MKILIITYSKEINPGTFLQAYAVHTAISKMFPEADIKFINYLPIKKGAGMKTIKQPFKHLLISKLYAIPRRIKYRYMQNKLFRYEDIAIDFFNSTEPPPSLFGKYDLIFVGSDTILENLSANNGKPGLMWLDSNVKAKKFFFAASAAPANFKVNDSLIGNLEERIRSFQFIGLRDNLTVDLFTKKLGIPKEIIKKQPDPTLLLDNNLFNLEEQHFKSIYRARRLKRQIALVNFNKNFRFIPEVVQSLRKKNFFIVSTIYNRDADANLCMLNPFEWGSLFKHIDIIVTERFHDLVFGLRNKKYVIAMDWNKERFSLRGVSKTYCILDDYDLLDHHMNVSNELNLETFEKLLFKYQSGRYDTDKIGKITNQQKRFYRELLSLIKSIAVKI